MTKICRDCSFEFPLEAFYPNSGSKHGRVNRCRNCYGIYQSIKYQKNPERLKEIRRLAAARNRANGGSFRQRYGITPEEKKQILAKQGGACAICRTKEVISERHWHLDHNHLTLTIRGVLCSNCNHMIGNADDNIETLRQGIEYLSSPVSYGIIPNGSDLKKY